MIRLARIRPKLEAACVWLLASFCTLTSTQCYGGRIVVSGDSTPAFSLSGPLEEEGNRAFYRNLLRSGSKVIVLDSTLRHSVTGRVNSFYDSIPDVESSIHSGLLTGEMLSNADLLLLHKSDDEFKESEVDAINDFLASSGTLYIAGEGRNIGSGAHSIVIINNLLTALDSSIRLLSTTVAIGKQYASGDSIIPSPLTTDVSRFRYGGTTLVEGGTTVIRAASGVLVAAEVPEPSTATLGIALYVAVVAINRQRNN